MEDKVENTKIKGDRVEIRKYHSFESAALAFKRA